MDARARLLRLQRMVGNQAVGRLLAQERAARPPARSAAPTSAGAANGTTLPIQRLVGFEVEMAVPTYRKGTATFNPGPQGTPSTAISAALTGGLEYNTKLGKINSQHNPAAEIRLKTDKYSAFTTHAQNVYEALAAEDPHEGLPLVPKDVVVKTSNLEYDTDALDEMAPGSNAAFKAMATAIDGHAQKIMSSNPKTTAFMIPDASPQTATGVPRRQILLDWVDLFNKPGLLPAVNGFGDAVQWQMFPQATVGILPTGLSRLFAQQHEQAQQQDKPEEGSLWAAAYDSLAAIDDGMTRLYQDQQIKEARRTWFFNPDAVGGTAEALDGAAFRGGLTLALSYAIGNALNATSLVGTTEKNAVPFLMKAKRVGSFKGTATTTWLRNNPPPAELVDAIATWFHDNVPQTQAKHWTDPPYNAEPGPTRTRVYGGDLPALDATKALLARMLRGTGKVTVLRSGNPIDPDPVSDVVKGTDQARGQAGFPLEYRWLSARPTGPGQVWSQVFEPVLADVRDANLQHLPEDQREAIKKTW